MEDNTELFVQDDSSRKDLLSKWLHIMILAQIVSLITPVFGLFRSLDGISGWITRAISAAVLISLYQLSAANPRYRKAAHFYLAGFIGGIIQAFLGTTLLTTAAGICGIVATYQEYTAHAELLVVKDTYLADKWNSLFYWEIAVGLIGGIGSIAVTLLGVGAGWLEDTIILIAFGIVVLLELPLGLLRLKYLKKMRLVLTQE
ncbi:MAG: hypothetical protein IJB59_08470 [Oscillospiraceae bacterium]|nr:hypothetical protein [Oscillospiraceae bacterium]